MAAVDEKAIVENVVVAGAHDFNTWDQMFTTFARDYLWKPQAFLSGEVDDLKDAVAGTSLNKGNRNALTVKLDHALLEGDEDGAADASSGFTAQVKAFDKLGKLTSDQAADLVEKAEAIRFNVTYWQ